VHAHAITNKTAEQSLIGRAAKEWN